ncbi:hypothetical protein D9758_005604 [Tetrapyrgos nigripes]|uniref:Uncharacterized protein n=1 Tax=Tetrapyrgos nigripes TaxID=182062 RepID=A0A8H5LNZ0_9AGAR|nr:hypothetical protein D9758_005604 [Tetrapyrgos nigripes]
MALGSDFYSGQSSAFFHNNDPRRNFDDSHSPHQSSSPTSPSQELGQPPVLTSVTNNLDSWSSLSSETNDELHQPFLSFLTAAAQDVDTEATNPDEMLRTCLGFLGLTEDDLQLEHPVIDEQTSDEEFMRIFNDLLSPLDAAQNRPVSAAVPSPMNNTSEDLSGSVQPSPGTATDTTDQPASSHIIDCENQDEGWGANSDNSPYDETAVYSDAVGAHIMNSIQNTTSSLNQSLYSSNSDANHYAHNNIPYADNCSGLHESAKYYDAVGPHAVQNVASTLEQPVNSSVCVPNYYAHNNTPSDQPLYHAGMVANYHGESAAPAPANITPYAFPAYPAGNQIFSNYFSYHQTGESPESPGTSFDPIRSQPVAYAAGDASMALSYGVPNLSTTPGSTLTPHSFHSASFSLPDPANVAYCSGQHQKANSLPTTLPSQVAFGAPLVSGPFRFGRGKDSYTFGLAYPSGTLQTHVPVMPQPGGHHLHTLPSCPPEARYHTRSASDPLYSQDVQYRPLSHQPEPLHDSERLPERPRLTQDPQEHSTQDEYFRLFLGEQGGLKWKMCQYPAEEKEGYNATRSKTDICGYIFRSHGDVLNHLKHGHTLPPVPNGKQVPCLWKGCKAKGLPTNMVRHWTDVHSPWVRVCKACGTQVRDRRKTSHRIDKKRSEPECAKNQRLGDPQQRMLNTLRELAKTDEEAHQCLIQIIAGGSRNA